MVKQKARAYADGHKPLPFRSIAVALIRIPLIRGELCFDNPSDLPYVNKVKTGHAPGIQIDKNNTGDISIYENSSYDCRHPGRLDRPAGLYSAEAGNFNLNAGCLSGDGHPGGGSGKPDSGKRAIDGPEDRGPDAGCRWR